MAGLKISILLLLASAIIGVSSLSCAPCDPDPAACDESKVLSCTAGIGKDVCGCCDVCSQALGENCGGPWNSTGVCGNNLKCLKQPLQNNYVDSFNLEGKCVLEIPEFDSNWFNGFDLTGFGGIDFSGFGDSVFTLINGVTFLNGIEIVEGKDCYTACTGTYWPVCGSDGISYPNECALLNLQCVNPDLKVAQNAACGVIPSVDPVFCHKAMCTREYRPVCGSDGKTYSNKCELNNAKCDDKALRMVHNSLCGIFRRNGNPGPNATCHRITFKCTWAECCHRRCEYRQYYLKYCMWIWCVVQAADIVHVPGAPVRTDRVMVDASVRQRLQQHQQHQHRLLHGAPAVPDPTGTAAAAGVHRDPAPHGHGAYATSLSARVQLLGNQYIATKAILD